MSQASVRTKRFLLGVVFAGVVLVLPFDSRNVSAMPAALEYQTLTQADGSEFIARQFGDEWSHGWETKSGYTILFDKVSANWKYAAKNSNGALVASEVLVSAADRLSNIKRHLRGRKLSAKDSPSIDGGPRRGAPVPADRVVPPTGTATVPVLMINYSDTSTIYGTSDFDSLLFSTGTKSMKDYYEEVSYGAFSVSAGPSGVVGWGASSNNHNYYGNNNIFGDRHPAELVIETVIQADAAGFDFAAYDNDGDCYVDVVFIVHQGEGEEASGVSGDIWSHRWNLASANFFGDGTGVYTTNDSAACGAIKVNDYLIVPETLYGLLNTVGVMAHEYGHSLGLPDLYDTDYTSSGIGRWGLMAGGSWNTVTRAGDTPAHMGAWSKYALGWVTPTQVTSTLTGEEIHAASGSGDVYQFLTGNPTGNSEYFLVENRQRTVGSFDEALPGDGLAIWHIDDAKNGNNDNECAPPSDCSVAHYNVALVQADGLWDLENDVDSGDAGDLFPGSTFNLGFTDLSTPSNALYDGTNSDMSVTAISASGPIMTATLDLTAPVLVPTPDVKINSSDGPLVVSVGVPVTITVAFEAGPLVGQAADWWLKADGTMGLYWYDGTTWVNSIFPVRAHSGALRNLPERTVLNGFTGLPVGSYNVYFAVDGNNDGVFDATYFDSVDLTVN